MIFEALNVCATVHYDEFNREIHFANVVLKMKQEGTNKLYSCYKTD